MANLQQVFVNKQLIELMRCQACVNFGQKPKSKQFSVFNVVAIFLGKQVFINPVFAAFGQKDGQVLVVIEPFFENTTAQVICLPQQNLLNSQAKIKVRDLCLVCIPGELGCLEAAVGVLDRMAPGATYCKALRLPGGLLF
jgi:hypothetical protein